MLLLVLAYFIAGRLGLMLPYVGSSITLIWLPTGIAVAALMRWGCGYWPGIWAGALLVNLAVGSSWTLAAGIACGNTLGPLLSALILRRSGFHRAFDRQRDVALLVLAAAIGMLVSASGGVASLHLAGDLPTTGVAGAWLSWWLGDGIGVLLAAPPLLTMEMRRQASLGGYGGEKAVWIVLAGVGGWIAFVTPLSHDGQAMPLVFLTLPLIVWAALRFGVTGASLAILALSGIAAWGATNGRGPFNLVDQQMGLMLLWAYMASSVLVGLLITALQAERWRAEAEIHRLAFYDALTQLPNRRLLHDRLRQALTACARRGTHGAILFIDLDNFKTLNDTMGHDVGDLLLVEVAQRLTGCVRAEDTVARLGGDEFVVMLENLSDKPAEAAPQAEAVSEKIRLALNRPYSLKGREHFSSPSIGISMFSTGDEKVDDLLKHADVALYKAKAAGRNTMRFFDPIMQAALDARATLEAELRRALQLRQFQLHFQLQVDGGNKVLGAEVLLRWQHPERGLIAPAEFIPLAEETGLIVPIGAWVLEATCERLKAWEANPATRNLPLAVNISARQFRQAEFVDHISGTLARTGANPQRLKLELTESLLLHNIGDVVAKMRALKALGIGFSMDDFGTGYSSLTYLKQLPFDQLKIDQSFIRDLATDSGDAAIVQTIINVAKGLGLNVIAEGVESEVQHELLDAYGCPAFQGYLFSHPLPVVEFEALIA